MAQSDGGSMICTEWPLNDNSTWRDYYRNKTCSLKKWGVTRYKDGAIGKNASIDDLVKWNVAQKATALLFTRPFSTDPAVINKIRLGYMIADDLIAKRDGLPRPVYNLTREEILLFRPMDYGLLYEEITPPYTVGYYTALHDLRQHLDKQKELDTPLTTMEYQVDGKTYVLGHEYETFEDFIIEWLEGHVDDEDDCYGDPFCSVEDLRNKVKHIGNTLEDTGENEYRLYPSYWTAEQSDLDNSQDAQVSDDPGSENKHPDKEEMPKKGKAGNNAEKRKQARKARKERKKMRRLRDNFRNAVAANQTVRAGVQYLPEMPEGSKAYVRAVLDPAHVKDYDPQGIPDANTVPTLVTNLQVNYTFNLKPTKMTVQTAVGTYSEVTLTKGQVDYVYIVQTGDSCIGYIALYFGQFTDNTTKQYDRGFTIQQNADLLSWLQSNDNSPYRVITKGYTTRHVGPKMYRGGIWTGSVHASSRVYNAGNDSSSPYIDLSDAENNQRFTTSVDGIYATLPIINGENSRKWRQLDNANTVTILWPDKVTWTLGLPGTVYLDSNRDLPSHYASVVKYIPPSSMTIGVASQTDVTIVITVFTSVEKQMPSSFGGHNSVTADEAAFRLVAGLLENAPSYYPSSYNDWKKVLRQLKKFYKDNRAAIDTAAGFIPYGKTVVGVLDALTGGKGAN